MNDVTTATADSKITFEPCTIEGHYGAQGSDLAVLNGQVYRAYPGTEGVFVAHSCTAPGATAENSCITCIAAKYPAAFAETVASERTWDSGAPL